MKRKAIVRRLATIIRITEEEVRQLRASSHDDTAAERDIEDLEQAFVGETAGEAEIELGLDQVQRLAALESPLREHLLALAEEMLAANEDIPTVMLETGNDGAWFRSQVGRAENHAGDTIFNWLPAEVRYIANRPVRDEEKIMESEEEARRWLGWET